MGTDVYFELKFDTILLILALKDLMNQKLLHESIVEDMMEFKDDVSIEMGVWQ